MKAKPHNFDEMLEMLSSIQLDEDGPIKPREIKRACITIVENVGEGNFGVVSKALFEDKGALLKSPAYLVAAKVLHSKDSTARTELLEEALTMVGDGCSLSCFVSFVCSFCLLVFLIFKMSWFMLFFVTYSLRSHGYQGPIYTPECRWTRWRCDRWGSYHDYHRGFPPSMMISSLCFELPQCAMDQVVYTFIFISALAL